MKSKLFKEYEKEFEQSEFKDKPNLREGWIMNKMKSDLAKYLYEVRSNSNENASEIIQLDSKINEG